MIREGPLSASDTRSPVAQGIANQDYARRVQLLIKLMTDLRAIGAQADIDLPRIAVIGNQSAGKSSLVEAISGISVPRASGTCTRCPMECRLTYSNQPWKCQVLLRLERDENGNRLQEVKETKFGPLLHDKGLLEGMLRRAQLAILNPSLPSASLVNYDLSHLQHDEAPHGSARQLSFSANVVCLDLSGPEVTNLSFIDLPGIISNVADGEDRNNIDLVKSLVKGHIAGNALILLTITMRDDIENQSAAFLAKSADPKGLRTIGVLTKPDTLQPGEEQAWLDVIEGRRHPLRHGYFVTKQPATTELDERLEHHVAREREQTFFSTTSPWKSASTAVHNRMGIPRLTKNLSKLLSQLIEQTLPVLRADTKSSLSDTLLSLNNLPPPPSENPTAELLRLITSFSGQLDKFIKGAEGCEGLIQKCRPAFVNFRDDIVSTTPEFRSTEKPLPEADEKHASTSGTAGKLDMHVDDVREYIEKSLTRQLPFNVPFSAKVGLISLSLEEWPAHAMICFSRVHKVFQGQLEELVNKDFDRFASGGLIDHVRVIVEGELHRAKKDTEERIKWLVDLEDPPFTLNDHYFSSYREKYLTKYKEERQRNPPPDSDPSAALAELAKLGFESLKAEDLHKLHGADKYESELIMMAEVRAYFQVAYKRIIDNLPRVIDFDFLRSVSGRMQDALIRGLGLGEENANQRATGYLSEEPYVVAQREELQQKKERLEEIMDKLFRFAAP